MRLPWRGRAVARRAADGNPRRSSVRSAAHAIMANVLHVLNLARRAGGSLRRAEARARGNTAGFAFARYGRRLGFRLLLRGKPGGIGYVISPVSMTRYFEF